MSVNDFYKTSFWATYTKDGHNPDLTRKEFGIQHSLPHLSVNLLPLVCSPYGSLGQPVDLVSRFGAYNEG